MGEGGGEVLLASPDALGRITERYLSAHVAGVRMKRREGRAGLDVRTSQARSQLRP